MLMNKLCPQDVCTGCFACKQVCAKSAIQIREIDGFSYPEIDDSLCVDCGLCTKVCPVLSAEYHSVVKEGDLSVSYAVWNKSVEARMSSSSGGVFSALAEKVLEEGGIVYGAAWDENMRLRHIGIDETSYRRGHKYITVVVNHDTNTVVWAAQGHGKKVLEQFYRQLTPRQLSSIRVVTGDGARWITDCVNEFTPSCERCVDPFHVVEWAMEALDEVRREVWREAHAEAVQAAKAHPRGKGRPKADDHDAKIVAAARAKAEAIKNSAFALGKAPEHLTENQQTRIAMIAENNSRLYRAYRMKETLRLLLKIKDVKEAEVELDRWLWWASHSRIPAFKELYKKIKRHKGHILNTIRLGMSNARIEATNNKIKLIIRKAYGFRNIQNMLDMVYLVCSDLRVPLPNRKSKAA